MSEKQKRLVLIEKEKKMDTRIQIQLETSTVS